MTITIELTSEEEARLREAAVTHGMDTEEFVRQQLLELSEASDDLTEDEVAEIRAGIRRGLADGSAGRVTSLSEWTAQKRRKYGLPEPGSRV